MTSTIEEINLQAINTKEIEQKSIQLISYIRIITVGTETAQISRIIKELEIWRKQNECWLICMYILTAASSNPTLADADIYFSVLNILLHKLRSDFYQLPNELHEPLKDLLLSFLRSLSQRHIRQPLAKLSEAVAALSLQMESWAAPVDDVIRIFGGNAGEAACAIHALMFMPEISAKEDVRVRSGRRKEYGRYLNGELPKVFEFLNCWLQNSGSDEELQGLVFRCLREWFRTCGVSLKIVKSSPLTAAMFVALSKSDLFDIAIDCICELVSVAK